MKEGQKIEALSHSPIPGKRCYGGGWSAIGDSWN